MKTIFETVKEIKSGKLSARELVKEHLKLAETKGKELNAILTIVDEALAKAEALDERIAKGEEVGKLAGIPFTVKDNMMTRNVRTTAGSKVLENFIAPYTATVVKKLEAEGAILIAKTNCDSFGCGGSGENSGYGPTKNPLDETRVPGGSSSGAAASMAAGIGYFALGTDTGGSVRQPAAFTGLVGFKPTYGRNSRYGLMSMTASLDTAGVFARNVADVALVEMIMAGKDKYDATTYELEVPDYTKSLNTENLAGKKFALPKEYLQQGIDEDVKICIEAAVEKLKAQGAVIEEISLPILKYAVPLYYVIVPSEFSSNMNRYDGVRYGSKVADTYLENVYKSRGQSMEAEIKRRIMVGTYALSAGYADQYYNTASVLRKKFTEEITAVLSEYDAIIGPTAPCVAFKIGEKAADPVAMYLTDVYTVTANIIGVPAISINCGENAQGLPIGLQITANKFKEDKLFKLAFNFEKIFNE